MIKIIDEIIDEALKRESKPRKIGHYYVSEIPYCLRKTWYRFKDPIETDKPTARIYQRGTLLHNWIADILKNSSSVKVLFNERSIIIPVKRGILLRGRLDDFIRIEGKKDSFVVEVKTTANIEFTKEPSREHIYQIMPYIMVEECKGIIVYVDARNLQTKEFIIDFDWDVWEEIKKRTVELHDHLTRDILPPPEMKGDKERGWQCDYCAYREKCWLGDDTKGKKTQQKLPTKAEDMMFFV